MTRTRIILFAALILLCCDLHAQTQTSQARVADAYGSAEKQLNPNDNRWQPISVGDLLSPSSSIRTGANSAVLLVFPDRHALRIGEGAQIQLKELGQGGSYLFELLKGQIWSFVNKARKPAKYEIETPSTVLGVSGTLFSVDHNGQTNESEVSVVDGEVFLGRGNAAQTLSKGFQTRIRRGQPGTPVEKIDRHTQQMWAHIRRSESWVRGDTNAKVDRQTEGRVRALKEERRRQAEQQQQKRQQQGKKQRKGGKKAPE